MMQANLFVLMLMGQLFFFTCEVYKYHFIREEKTWDEAWEHCNNTHTDLASVFDKTDVQRLRGSANNPPDAWIGLYSFSGKANRAWHWSMPGVEFKNDTKWEKDEPNDKDGVLENCVGVKNTNKWADFDCCQDRMFLCYNETKQPNKRFHFIDDKKTWRKAQRHCREHFTDLVSGITQIEDKELEQINKSKPFWIGLFRDTWRWSDGNNFSFRNWESDDEFSGDRSITEKNNKTCAAMSCSSGKWKPRNCTEKKPFFCYEDKVVLVKQNKTWEEALEHCREKHHELVSITDQHQQRWVAMKAKQADSPFVWLGLRYTCTLGFWFWISDEVVSYKNWATNGQIDECDMSGAMETKGQHKWISQHDEERFNFICVKE